MTVAGGTVDGSCQVEVDPSHGGPGQIADGDGVGPAKSVDSNVLHAAEVQCDAADVVGESDPAAIGRDVDSLRHARAIEDHRVGYPSEVIIGGIATLDSVVAVALVPDEGVGALAAD